MASQFVHAVHSMIAFGLPNAHVHARKDRFCQIVPGRRHRAVRHRRYRQLSKDWTIAQAYPLAWERQVERIGGWKGDTVAEEFMVSAAHDVDDKVWDFDDRSPNERAAVRKYWEGFCVWIVLNPGHLMTWAGVDVIEGRIHRVIDGVEIWESEPTLASAYQDLLRRAHFLLRVDRRLREALNACG